jgi:predicted membrane protein
MAAVRPTGADAWVRNRLFAGAAVLLAGRLVLSLVRTGPVLVADEIGYLTNARVLIGGLPGQLQGAPYYRGGYSLLISPLVGLNASPTFVYHLILVLNAVLAASLVGLLYLVLTRCVGFEPRQAVWPALVGAAYPSITVFSQVALSENALFPLTCVWLLCLGGVLGGGGRPRSLWWALALGGSAAALWIVHGRMITALALSGAVAAWLVVRRRAFLEAAVLVAVLAVGIEAAHLLNSYLVNHNYGGHATNEANARLSGLNGAGPLLAAVSNLIGQLWYLITATFGLVLAVVVYVMPGRGAAMPPARRTFLVWLLALTGLLLLVSAGSFPVRTRPDMLIYGRYVEVATPPLVAVGAALLAGRGLVWHARYLVAALVPLTLIVVVSRLLLSPQGAANRWNIASLPFLTFQLGPAVLVGAAALTIGGAWLLARVAAWTRPSLALRSPVAALALGLFLAVTLYGELNPVLDSERSVYPAGWTSPEPVTRAHRITRAAYDLASYDEIGLYVTQWFLPHTRLALFDGARRLPPARYVISGAAWPREHPGTRPAAFWRDVGRNQVLWQLAAR